MKTFWLIASTFFAATLPNPNFATRYGASSNPQTPPPQSGGEHGQWGGVGGHGHSHGSESPEFGSEKYEDQGANLFSRQTHVERYGYPEGCVKERDPVAACTYFVEISKEENDPNSLHFELVGHVNSKVGGYVAVGLSRDKIMGKDHIVECVMQADGSSRHYQSWSLARTQPKRLEDDPRIIKMDDSYPRYDRDLKVLTCKFRRPIVTHVEVEGTPIPFNLEHDKYYILLSNGNLLNTDSDKIGYHGPSETGKAYVSRELLGYQEQNYEPRYSPDPHRGNGNGNGNFDQHHRNGQQIKSVVFPVFLLTLFSYLFV